MFGNATQNGAAPAGATADGGMLTMEQLLGKKVTDAAIIEGGAKPKGTYGFSLAEITEGEYEIKKEEHPRVGQKAMMLTFVFDIVAVDATGKYVDAKGKRVSPEAMQEYVGKQFKENVMFGNDGLPKDDGTVNQSGYNKLVTILAKVIGDVRWAELEAAGASTQDLIQAAQGVKFLGDISHNKWDDNVNDQLDLFGDFQLVNE